MISLLATEAIKVLIVIVVLFTAATSLIGVYAVWNIAIAIKHNLLEIEAIKLRTEDNRQNNIKNNNL